MVLKNCPQEFNVLLNAELANLRIMGNKYTFLLPSESTSLYIVNHFTDPRIEAPKLKLKSGYFFLKLVIIKYVKVIAIG